MQIIRASFTLKTTSLILLRSIFFSDDEYRIDPMPISQASLLAFAMLSEYPLTVIIEYNDNKSILDKTWI
jgi:hypothetical protein